MRTSTRANVDAYKHACECRCVQACVRMLMRTSMLANVDATLSMRAYVDATLSIYQVLIRTALQE
jgi:hypothetical protein